MDNLIRDGYAARKVGDVDREINLFKQFCQREHISVDDSLQAELKWESRLSELKWRNHILVSNSARQLGWNDY